MQAALPWGLGGSYMREDDGGRQFIAFVHKIRKQQDYTMEQVCEGICSLGTIHFMESGRWKSDKLVRDRILDRLGAGVEDYEHYLDLGEYSRSETRNRIIHYITYRETDRAEGLLEEYRKNYDMENDLERQFVLCMEVQVRHRQGGEREEIAELLEEAAALTIPELHRKPLEKLVLSAGELNLVLEAEAYRKEGARTEKYRQILDYIRKKNMDGIARAKIYPKAVYFLCRHLLGEKDRESEGLNPEELLQYCESAVEILRDNARMYYLCELLEMEGCLADLLAQRFVREGRQKEAGMLKEWYQKRADWKRALEAVYEEQGMSRESMDFCYFYLEMGVHCVNDIIRIRREMLGISRQELCDGICDEKTLKRLEKRKTKPQLAVVEGLLERLGLPAEYTRSDLITDSAEARELMRQLRRCVNHGLLDQVPRLLERIRTMVPMNIRFNRQAIERENILNDWKKEELAKEEYYSKMLAVLELTLPYDAFLKEGKKYLTYIEQECIQNLMFAMDEISGEYTLCMQRFEEIYQPFTEKEQVETVSGIYEMVMRNIGSDWGNRGEYERSDRYGEVILRNCLAYCRLESIKSCLYNRWWNYDKRRSEGIPNAQVLDDRDELNKCITFADMAKDIKRMEFYQGKLK